MEIQLQLVVSTLIMPIIFSSLLKLMMAKKILKTIDYAAPGIFLVWLGSYLWIVGLPSLPPSEAVEWISVLGITFIIYSLLSNASRSVKTAVQIIFLIAGFVILSWPVLASSFSVDLLMELMIFSAVGLILFKRLTQVNPVNPTVSLGISNMGIAVVASLGGSLLIGQLAAALAASLSAFIVYEFYKKAATNKLSIDTMYLLVLISMSILLVARIYAEIPLTSVLLLLVSLLVGLSNNWRYATWLSVLAAGASIMYLFLTADDSSYI